MAQNAAVRRLKKEYASLQKEPTQGAHVQPLETNFLHAHFILLGEVFHDTPYEGGVYHGVLKFPSNYPLKPPTVIMRTPSARFQPDQKICFSMSDFHPELWNPMWSIRSILTGLISFMNSEDITTGGVKASSAHRIDLAKKSLKHCMEHDALASELFKDELESIAKGREGLGSAWPTKRNLKEKKDLPKVKENRTKKEHNIMAMHHQQRTQRQGVTTFLLATKYSSIPILVILAFVGLLLLLLLVPSGVEAFSPSSHYSQSSRSQSYTSSTTSRTTTPLRRSRSRTTTGVSSSTDDTLESLQDLPFVPKEVLSKFVTNVGTSLTSANLQAGYEAGVVTRQELDDIQQLLPETQTQTESIQSIAEIRGHWDNALSGQPWVIQKLGEFAAPTVVGLVAKMQEKTVRQAGAMAWINHAALEVLQANTTILTLLSSSSSSSTGGGVVTNKLRFNNTRARFEDDKQVWSASMDVFFVENTTPIESSTATQTDDGVTTTAKDMDEPTPSTDDDNTALLAALMEGTDDDTDDLSSLWGSVTVVDENTRQSSDAAASATTTTKSSPPVILGLVNAYFIPEEEIKILVVEIDDVLHNVTWKGL